MSQTPRPPTGRLGTERAQRIRDIAILQSQFHMLLIFGAAGIPEDEAWARIDHLSAKYEPTEDEGSTPC